MSRRDLRRTATVVVAIALCGASGGHAQAPPDRRLAAVDACVLPDPAVTFLDSLDAVPEVIRTDLLARTGAMAARTEPFDAADFTTPATASLPRHRFLRAAHSGLRWMIWYEHGGYSDHTHLAVYVIVMDGRDPTPVAHLSENLVGPPCAAAEAVLKGVAAAAPRDW